jgi:hypothetical protein
MIAMMKHMNYPSEPVHRILIAGVTLIYVVLLVVSTGCTLAHAEQVSNHHHDHGKDGSSPQNPFCAWACQATADAVVAMTLPTVVTQPVDGRVDLLPHPFLRSVSFSTVHPRAPPSILFVRLG